MTVNLDLAPRISFEFFPPAGAAAEAKLHLTIDRLAPLAPDFVTVTYGAGGSTKDRTDRIVRALLSRGDLETAAHLTCVGASRQVVEETARAWAAAGLRRIVALRGDMPEVGEAFRPHPQGYASAAELVAGLRRIADFDISVGAYPEVHPEAASEQSDLDNLKRKLDAGAARAITQYFFDAEVFLRFRDRAVAAGIDKPIVAGILPIFDFAKVKDFSGRCGASIPNWLASRFEGLDSETQALVAATTASELCRRLQAEGVEDFHFYTLNRTSLTYAVCRLLGVRPTLEKAA